MRLILICYDLQLHFILDDSFQDATKPEELKETVINEAPESRWYRRHQHHVQLIRLRSWKNDYLTANSHRRIYPSAYLSPNNLWRIKIVGHNKIKLQNEATKLYLHRPDSRQGVTTWHTGHGNIWTLEGHIKNGQIVQLKSWKTDYLHRDAGHSITTWSTGIGNKWTVVVVKPTKGGTRWGLRKYSNENGLFLTIF